MNLVISIVVFTLGTSLLSPCLAQTPAPSLLAPRVSPQDPVPGLVARVYLNAAQPKSLPTHVLAVIKDGDDFMQNYKTLALDELRGITKSAEILYVASGFIVLDKDASLKFNVEELHCLVDGKDFGPGVYNQNLKKGKHTLEVYRMWGHGLRGFSITAPDAAAPVLMHTGEQLSRELGHSVKLEGRTYKSKQVGVPAAAPK